MSDSDLSDNVFTFQKEGSIVSVNGPNININNLPGISFRNNDLTLNMPSIMSKNNEWQRRTGSNNNQRSMWCRRDTSPMSTASACDMRQRNYNNVSRAFSSQRLNSERARSPAISLRSIDSHASNLSAVEIITAIKQFRGSNYEMKRIQDACKHKYMKHRTRAGIEKRRNLRVFLKGYRRKSGYDSGELASNSSSSDDDRSTRAPNYKNMSSCRSTIMDIANIRRNIKDSNMFKDSTNNFRQNKTLSMVNGSTNLNSIRSLVSPSRSMIEKPTIPKLLHCPPVTNINITHNQSSVNQSKCYGDRFKNRFLLPSQRFNQSIAATSIAETSLGHSVPINNPQERNSDDEAIFSEPTFREKTTSNLKKRGIDGNDHIVCLPNNKKPKVDIVQKDFEFAQPAFPVRKVAKVKSKEIVISTSTNMNPTEKLISKSASLPPIHNILEPEDEKDDNTELQTTSQNNTVVSMRPSFMKRKLFSQKMDVTEKINDMANSPQNSIYGKIQKEKNKARKLVTSQYCLSRDIHTDETNVLDLIHKIVPAECMNATTQSNKTNTQNKADVKDNGVVTSIISVRNNEDLSDTFTDEDELIDCNGEVFSPKMVKKVSPMKNVQNSPPKPLLEKSPVKKLQKSPYKVSKLSQNIPAEQNGTATERVKKMEKYIKSFWDTDFESEDDFTPASQKRIEKVLIENKITDAAVPVAYNTTFHGISSPVNNATMINTTVDSTQKFSNINSMFKLCSHRNNKSKKIVCDKANESTTQIKPLRSEHKNTKSNICLEVTELESYTQPVSKKPVKPKLEKPKPLRKKSLPKKQSQAKVVKNNTTNTDTDKEKGSQTINSINNTLGKVNAIQSKSERKDGLDKKNIKKGATASQNKIENNLNKTKHDKVSQNLIIDKPQINEASKSQKPDIKDKTINNKKPNIKKKNLTKLSGSLIYEDSFSEINNYSNRPVRSCRLSKQNNSLDTSKINQTLNVTLRSRLKKPDEKKPAPKRSKSKDQANLSDLSLIVAQNKPILSIKSRLREGKKKDYSDSDISFSLTDKDSRLKSMPLNTTNKKEFVSKEPRPVRTVKSNKRYFS